jgi:5'-nucleotidase
MFKVSTNEGRQMRKLVGAAAALAAVLLAVPTIASAEKPPPKDNDTAVQLLAINDFHGHVESTTPGTIRTSDNVVVPAGGAEYLATWIKNLSETNSNTLFVGSGDLVGASPLTSALFHDEPAMEALNMMGMDVSGVGNHEFDEGLGEIYRLLHGGCHPTDGCQDGDSYLGTLFGYLAANVFFAGTNETVLPPYEIRKIDNAKIAFIGMTLEGTPLIVVPSAVAGLEFRPEVSTANALVQKLRAEQGVRTFVILLHQGGFQNAPFSRGFLDPNGCDNMTGDIVNIANQLDPQVDVIVSGHTHAAYNCKIGGKLVTSASSFGRVVTDIDLVIDHQTKDVKSATAKNVVVMQTVPKDAAQTALVNKYKTLAAPIANRVLGSITADLKSGRDGPGNTNAGGESALGDVIADGQLEATAPTDFGASVVAFMNPGGIRAPLLYAQISGGELPGQVTYGEAFNVQPFGNTLVVKTMTGAQIQRLLDQQWLVTQIPGQPEQAPRILQVSWTLNYSWSDARPLNDRVIDGSVMIGDAPLDPLASYRVTMNNFLADGGDGFSVFREGTNQLGGEVDLDAFGRYLMRHSPIAPPALDRIIKVP